MFHPKGASRANGAVVEVLENRTLLNVSFDPSRAGEVQHLDVNSTTGRAGLLLDFLRWESIILDPLRAEERSWSPGWFSIGGLTGRYDRGSFAIG